MMEMANTSLSHDEIVQLVDQMFVTSGLERRNSLRFKDFTRVLSVRMDMLWDVCLDWKGQYSSSTDYTSGHLTVEVLSENNHFMEILINNAAECLHVSIAASRRSVSDESLFVV